MKVFVIPSWYPSPQNPTYGIFVQEQLELLAKHRPEWKIGVSTWGQGNDDKLLWVRDHVKNLSKVFHHIKDQPYSFSSSGVEVFYQPALAWSKRFLKGNLREIIRCNELNFKGYVREHGLPDILSVQACYPGVFLAHHLSKRYGLPVHLHLRLGGFMFQKLLTDLGSLKNEMLKLISSFAIITATSSFHAKEMKRWIPNAEVLYNPVNTDFFTPCVRYSDYALAVGRLEPEKGFHLLLDALKQVPGISLKIIGDGSQRKILERRVACDATLSGRIRFLGQKGRDEVKEHVQKAKFLILPSLYETFGNVILEAMSCGRPIVATACGGPQEIVNEKTGLLCKPNDSASLREAIIQMNATSDRYQSDIIRAEVTSRFNPEKWANRLETLVRSHI